MAIFEKGTVIKTEFGAPIEVVSYIAGGGQGDVYVVNYNGKRKALKWYKAGVMRDPDAFYKNLKRNAEHGSPDKAFLWPDAVTEHRDGTFGYIMDLRPEGYYELGKLLGSPKYNFKTFKAATDACLKIVSAFRILHNNGYSYQDLNDGNFFINPDTGDVRICDNDNVAPNGTSTGILGKPRYMAPEIVVGGGKVLPDTNSDRYSLSAILFLILFLSHPLEGKRWLVPCLTDALAEKLYGSEALFICDPKDSSNGPVRNIHTNLLNRWGFMPDYLKDMFLKAFSKEVLFTPGRRIAEVDWLKVLVRFRSDIVNCSCGNETFIQNAATTKCDRCGKNVVVTNVLGLPAYDMTAAKGSRIYRCQVGICNADEALDPVMAVVAKPTGELGLKNMTSLVFNATTPSGKSKQIAPQDIIPFIPGIKIEAYGKTVELK